MHVGRDDGARYAGDGNPSAEPVAAPGVRDLRTDHGRFLRMTMVLLLLDHRHDPLSAIRDEAGKVFKGCRRR